MSNQSYQKSLKRLKKYVHGQDRGEIVAITKRIVLSEKSKLFDLLGWISPVLIQFTIFCQDLWIDGF